MLPHPLNKKKALCVAAGKSGGHLIPALELAKTWREQHDQNDVVLCTYGTQLDQKIYNAYPFISTVKAFNFTTFVLRKVWRYPIIAYQAVRACVTAWRLLRGHSVERVITTGGFVALPVCIAAKLLRIPIDVYELNVHPGKAVQAIARLGARVHVVFEQTRTAMPKATAAEYPIRFSVADRLTRVAAQQQLTQAIASALPLQPERKTLFILGGSQGSQYLNELVLQFLAARPDLHSAVQIIHQTGGITKRYVEAYERLGVPHLVFDFHQSMAACYQAADLTICRAGAGTLFELKFFNQPAVIVPLVAASTGHQSANAAAIQQQCPQLFTVWEQAAIGRDQTAFFDAVAQRLFCKV
jgi:UDP-N-acetylglucosamine--N-acetylmuramyl-(pentapeptide) pyrophosphoryl-undecaprenol N-acetylglucosamine transferase